MKNFFNKKFSTKTKLISSAISLMLIVCFAITGTVAWLIDTSGPVEDTFTFGKVDIELWDATNDKYWSATEHQAAADANFYVEYTKADSTTTKGFKLIPGASFDFNPAVKVLDGSESCYVFVKIEVPANLAAAIEPLKLTDWTRVSGFADVYAYTPNSTFTKVDATDNECIIVEDGVMVTKTSATSATLQAVGEDKIKITAYAIQSEHLTPDNTVPTPEAAWALINN